MAIHSKATTSEVSTRVWVGLFIPYLRPFRARLVLAVVGMMLDAGLTVLRPWPLKVVIDRVLSGKHTRLPLIGTWLDSLTIDPTYVLMAACASTLLIALGTGSLTYLYTRATGSVAERFVFALRRDLFAHMQRLSLRFHDSQRTGDLTTRITNDMRAVEDLATEGPITFVYNAFLLLGMVVVMLTLNWQFAIAALSVTPLLFWTILRYTKRIKAATRDARRSDGLLASVTHETLASIRIVQGLAQEDQQDARFHTQNLGGLQARLVSIRYQARVAPLVDILAAVGLAAVMWFGATRVLAGELTTGDMVVFFAYVTNLYGPMRALSRLSYTFNRAGVSAERIAEVLRTRSEVNDGPGARPAPKLKGAIEFRDVSFEYASGHQALSGINLRIAPGEKVAIVGATGAGKTTLVGLVPRFFDPTAGAVLIDGADARSYQLQTLRNQVSLVLQDSLLFRGTIRENIAFGCPGATDEQIYEAASKANASSFIMRSPNGYDTLVSERGTTLSGGQKQRIAIARALVRDAPILILDEPTSGLDASSEQLVIEALERAATGRTTLIIAHRLTTVRFADRIVVVENGIIVEEGGHQELLLRNGTYARYYRLQFDPAPHNPDLQHHYRSATS